MGGTSVPSAMTDDWGDSDLLTYLRAPPDERISFRICPFADFFLPALTMPGFWDSPQQKPFSCKAC